MLKAIFNVARSSYSDVCQEPVMSKLLSSPCHSWTSSMPALYFFCLLNHYLRLENTTPTCYSFASTASALDTYYSELYPQITSRAGAHRDISSWFILCVHDLAMVDDQRIAPCTLRTFGPADLFGKGDTRICHEKLSSVVSLLLSGVPITVKEQEKTLTIPSPLIPFAFLHASITQASFIAITATMSTPFSFKALYFSIYPGR